MKNRREFLASLSVALPAVAVASTSVNAATKNLSAFKACPRDITGPTAHRFPQ